MRKIIHIDMDAFFASIEQREHPEFRGKPLIVGGAPDSRGVVATCSYEARVFGVKSAMSSKEAYRRCPQAIFLKPDFELYCQISEQIQAIFTCFTNLVEPLSLDEAYLDVTELSLPATEIAKKIKQKIWEETNLTASAGVSYNKFLAKIASSLKKPNGLMVIKPKEAELFLELLPVSQLPGIGKVTQKKLEEYNNIRLGKDLKKLSQEELAELFGARGLSYYDLVRGIDDSPVETNSIRKSLGKEVTLEKDIDDRKECLNILEELVQESFQAMEEEHIEARTITLKITYFDFKKITRSITYPTAISGLDIAMFLLKELLAKIKHRKIRLLGVSFSNFEIPCARYFSFFNPSLII